MLDKNINNNFLLNDNKIEKKENDIKVNKNIVEHAECIFQMEKLHTKLNEIKEELATKNIKINDQIDDIKDYNIRLTSKNTEIQKYVELCDNYKNIIVENEKRYTSTILGLKNENERLKLQVKELLYWKNNHVCKINSDDIEQDLYDKIYKDVKEDIINEFNVKDSSEYIELKNINEQYNFKISDLEIKLEKLNLDVKNNVLFKQMKKKNDILNNEIIELKKENTIKNNSINFDKQVIIDEIKSSLETNFLTEKKEIKDKYENIISNLNIKINSLENKSNKNKTVKKENKYNKEYLYKGFSIFEDDDIEWKKIAGCFTYKKFKLLYKFNDAIENDKNINQNTYNEVIEYLNEKAVYNGDGKIKKISPYYKNKLKRVSELYNIFRTDLININIKTSFITSLNKEQFELFINILREEINKRNLNLNDISSYSSESVNTYYNNNNENILKCVNEKCNNYYEDYNEYCEICNTNTKICDNCGDEFITDKKHIIECGSC